MKTLMFQKMYNSVKNWGKNPKNIYCRVTEFGPPMWQAEANTELTLSAMPATAVGQILLTMAKFC